MASYSTSHRVGRVIIPWCVTQDGFQDATRAADVLLGRHGRSLQSDNLYLVRTQGLRGQPVSGNEHRIGLGHTSRFIYWIPVELINLGREIEWWGIHRLDTPFSKLRF